MKLKLKNTPEQVELIKAMGAKDQVEAAKAQSAFAEFIRTWEFDTGHLMDVNKETDIYLMPEKELEKAMESYCHTNNEIAEA